MSYSKAITYLEIMYKLSGFEELKYQLDLFGKVDRTSVKVQTFEVTHHILIYCYGKYQLELMKASNEVWRSHSTYHPLVKQCNEINSDKSPMVAAIKALESDYRIAEGFDRSIQYSGSIHFCERIDKERGRFK